MLRKIDRVMVHVDDLEAAARYYADLFGFKRHWSDATSIGMGMPETDAKIVLHTLDIPAANVDYLVGDVVPVVEQLRRQGCVVREEPFDIAIGKCAVIEDRLGNVWSILDMSKGPRPLD